MRWTFSGIRNAPILGSKKKTFLCVAVREPQLTVLTHRFVLLLSCVDISVCYFLLTNAKNKEERKLQIFLLLA